MLRPRAIALSAFAASAIARSGTSVTMALTVGLTRSICARCVCITSRAETSFDRIIATSSVAGRKQRSMNVGEPVSASVSSRYALRRVVEERLFGDALAGPALVGQLLHLGHRAVEPVETEAPADHDAVPADEQRADALGVDRPRPREHPALVRHV